VPETTAVAAKTSAIKLFPAQAAAFLPDKYEVLPADRADTIAVLSPDFIPAQVAANTFRIKKVHKAFPYRR
jgi:hypothetical protein